MKFSFKELKELCNDSNIAEKILVERLPNTLENARIIFKPIKEIFDDVQPIIEKIIKNDEKVQKDLKKVARERARSKGRQSTWAEKLHCINHKALIKSGLTIYDRTSLLKRVKLTARGEQK